MRVRRLPWIGKFQLLAVCRDRGECLLLDFLNGLEADLANDRDKMLGVLERSAINGPDKHNTEVSRPLGFGIYEFKRGNLRVLWFYDSGRVIVCTHGFVKKGQKTPRQQIDTAQRHMERYLTAKGENTLEVSDE